jgi:hypothetical protein
VERGQADVAAGLTIACPRLVVYPVGRQRASRRMTSVLSELPLSYAMLSESHWFGSSPQSTSRASPTPPYPASSMAPAGPSTRATPPLAQYGDRLICVRYRYDAQRRKRLTTVELLVAERDWEPPPLARSRPDRRVPRRLCRVAVRDRVKQAGGTWNPARRVWPLRYDRVATLGLTAPIADEPHPALNAPRLEQRESPCRCQGAIQVETLASTVGCWHPVPDNGVAVQ